METTEILCKALNALSKRINNLDDDWIDYLLIDNKQYVKCMICNTVFINKDYIFLTRDNLINDMVNHGINHLKEYNLLSFL